MLTRRKFLASAAAISALPLLPSLGMTSANAVTPGDEFDLFTIAGQSNGTGYGNLAESPAVVGGHLEVRMPRIIQGKVVNEPAYLKALCDPIKQAQDQPIRQSGSMWPAFANEWFNLTGRKVVICGGCRDGQGLLDASWALDEPYVRMLREKVDAAKSLLAAQGATGILRGCIWVGGEHDAQLQKSRAAWRDAFIALLARLRTAHNAPALPMFCVSLDRMADFSNDASFAEIRAAQVEACSQSTGLSMVSAFHDFAGQGMMINTTSAHWNQAALNMLGAEVAVNVAANLF